MKDRGQNIILKVCQNVLMNNFGLKEEVGVHH